MFILASAPAIAQSQDDTESERSVRVGPLRLTPSVSVTNVGIDSNVFNEVENPKRDFTATLTPKTGATLRLGRARVVANGAVDFVYLRRYASQRSRNLSNDIRLEMPLNRVVPYVARSSANTRGRFGNEIDARVHHLTSTTTFGTHIRVGGKTEVEVSALRSEIGFGRDATFLGVDLREALNRATSGTATFIRYNATPLTRVGVRVETQRDRFEFSRIRNADSLRVMPGVEMNTFALVTGTAHVGFQRFQPLDSALPAFAGVAADVELGYTLFNVTRFAVRALRDIEYSYDDREPYYVITGLSGSVARHVGGPWEIIGNIGRQQLDYQATRAVTIIVPNTDRVDVVSNYGLGVGYRLDRRNRLDLKLEYYRRRSPVAHYRDYDGFRLGTSVTYGLR